MANPTGENNLFIPEPSYGAKQKTKGLTKEVPLRPAPGVNAPQRSQRAAVHGRIKKHFARAAQQAQEPAMPPVPGEPPMITDPGVVWSQIAAIPGVTPLAEDYARRSQSGNV